MRVFVAGATGVVGRPLVRKLVEAGHEVTGTTRSEERAEGIRASGAEAAVCDALDYPGMTSVLAHAKPEVVINQLTSFQSTADQKDPEFFAATNRLRSEGGRILIEASQAVAVKRFITQSISFTYATEGSWVKDETADSATPQAGPQGETFRAMLEHERIALDAGSLEALVLRYGFFYGPGTWYAGDGSTADEVRKRKLPIVGPGTGVFSFVHVEDAADATVAAVSNGAPGIYNVVDDQPAPMKEWLPVYAKALGAKPPRKVPFWLARMVAGKSLAESAVQMRGADNTKAKKELGWTPTHPSWREGLFDLEE